MTNDRPNILVFPPAVSIAAPLIAIALEFVWPLQILPLFAEKPLLTIAGGVILGVAGWLAISAERALRPPRPT